ncbi:unnamed protein product [Echinostoma caproni]|uniref:Peptidase_M1 domain-containing protein n=1 Tax=Echinostoma caproni TaxID=27848 RepID=A0A183AZ28_9TREM|nr:unnamed protein product [Echinostoma caproni]
MRKFFSQACDRIYRLVKFVRVFCFLLSFYHVLFRSRRCPVQWFGNLVTLNWWDDLWLNEGFASFIESIGVNHVHPEWGMDEQFLLDDMQKVLTSDSLSTSRPVFQPVYYPNEINEIFDPISYNKGAAVLRMMESFMGRNAFRLGLKHLIYEVKSEFLIFSQVISWNSSAYLAMWCQDELHSHTLHD